MVSLTVLTIIVCAGFVRDIRLELVELSPEATSKHDHPATLRFASCD